MSDRQESVTTPEAGPPKHDHPVLRRVFKVVLAVALTLYFIAAGLFLGLRYLLLPRIDQFRPRIETLVSQKLHAQLRIGKLAPHWSGLQPGVDVTNLTIRGSDGRLGLSVPHATAALSWKSLVRFAPTLSSLVVDQPDLLTERKADGSLFVAGVAVPTTHSGDDTFSTWLLKQEAIVLRGGTLRWRDAEHPAPELALKGIRAAVLNDGLTHRLALQAPANGTLLLGPLDFRARFKNKPLAPIGKPANWTGEAYISTGPVDLPALARYTNIPLTAYAGRIDNAIWADFRNGHLYAAHGSLRGYDVALRVRPTQPRLDIPVAGFGWDLAIDPKRDYTLHLSHLHAELGQPPLADGTPLSRSLSLATLTARYRVPSVEHGQLLSVAGDRVDLGILAEFVRGLPLPARFRNELVRFDPRGLVANYDMEIERAKPANAAQADEERKNGTAPIIRYRFNGDLQGISFEAQEPPPGLSIHGHPRAGIPGVENLWGHVDANEKEGSASFDTVNAAVTVPGVFDEPRLAFNRLRGRANWTITPAAGEPHASFNLTVPEFYAANADAALSGAATYTNPGHGRGLLDLNAQVQRAAAAHLVRYLPTSLSDRLRAYLGHALQSGQVTKGATIVAKGPLDTFPYTHDPKAGVFHIVAPFSNGRFEPTPYPPRRLANGAPDVWPALDGISGVFEMAQNKLRIDIDRAHYKGVALSKVTFRIADLGNPTHSPLMIDGHAHGPLADLLDYANHSSLGAMTSHAGDRIHAQGPATLALKLSIPQHTPHPHVGVEGTLGFAGNTLATDGSPPLSNLRGNVRFTQHTLALDRITGRFLGGDLRASGALAPTGRYAFDVNGRVAVAAARDANLHGPTAALLERVVGDAPYQLTVRGAKGGLPDITARSDLTGLALDFPAPFAKPAGTPMPFSFTLKPVTQDDGRTLEHADLQLGPIAATYLLDAERGKPVRAVRGTLGINRTPDLPQDGVTAAVDVPAFDADAWQAFAQAFRASPRAQEPQPGASRFDLASFVPKRFALHFGTLTLLKRNWENVIVGASHVDDQWQANIASNQVSGYVSWAPGGAHDSAGVLNARLAKLVIPDSAEHDLVGPAMNLPTPANHTMPSIDLVVDQVVEHGHDIGRLAVNAHNYDEHGVPVWQLDKLELSNPAATLTATGNWRTSRHALAHGADENDAPRRTVFDFKLDIGNAGNLLTRLGLPRTVADGRGTLSGQVAWRGGPTAIDYPTLDGTLALDLQHGQILKVDPGAAKVLGVLSLQSLVRFLTFDFRDVIGHGLPFEQITGTGQITNGTARTHDFEMTTAPAKVTVTGSVDLAHETQDLRAHVAPKVSAGAAAIAAAVVNPFLGLGVLAANLALSQTLSHAFALDYAITGSWAHPHIERLHSDQGKMNLAPADTASH